MEWHGGFEQTLGQPFGWLNSNDTILLSLLDENRLFELSGRLLFDVLDTPSCGQHDLLFEQTCNVAKAGRYITDEEWISWKNWIDCLEFKLGKIMSNFYFLFILGMCVFYSVWLSLEFSVKSKFYIFWTIPVGFFGCFVALAIFALIVGQTDDVSFMVATSAVFLPFPIWRLFKQQNKQVLPTSASRPKETAAPSPLFNIHKNVKSNIEQQKVLI